MNRNPPQRRLSTEVTLKGLLGTEVLLESFKGDIPAMGRLFTRELRKGFYGQNTS